MLTQGHRSVVVDYLDWSMKLEDIGLAYVYCNYKEQEEQTVTNLISSIVQQLVQRHDDVPEEIMSLYRHHIRRQTRPMLGEWSKLLQSEVNRFSNVFIVVDALDECPEDGTRESFLTEIKRVQKVQPSVRLFVTSRPSPTIEAEFETANRLEIRASDADVQRYLEQRIATSSQMARHVRKDSSLQGNIVNAILEQSKGM